VCGSKRAITPRMQISLAAVDVVPEAQRCGFNVCLGVA